jgi:hypothetical protein
MVKLRNKGELMAKAGNFLLEFVFIRLKAGANF